LLEALFMQISGVSLAVTWPSMLCLLWVLLCMSRCYKLSLSKHTGGGDTTSAFLGLHVCLQLTWKVGLPPILWNFPPTTTFTSFSTPDYWAVLLLLPTTVTTHMRGGSYTLSCGVFLRCPSHKLSCSWLLGAWPAPTGASLACLACLFNSQEWFPFPIFGALCSPPCFLHVFIVIIAYYSVSLFSHGGGLYRGGYEALAQGCLWEYQVLLSSPCPCLPKPSDVGDSRPGGHPGFSI
jgi:hypothetical protein